MKTLPVKKTTDTIRLGDLHWLEDVSKCSERSQCIKVLDSASPSNKQLVTEVMLKMRPNDRREYEGLTGQHWSIDACYEYGETLFDSLTTGFMTMHEGRATSVFGIAPSLHYPDAFIITFFATPEWYKYGSLTTHRQLRAVLKRRWELRDWCTAWHAISLQTYSEVNAWLQTLGATSVTPVMVNNNKCNHYVWTII